MKPIEGMKQDVWGLPLMGGAWFGLLEFAIGKKELVEQFKADTGHDICGVLLSRGLAAMIDEATGRKREIVAAFADWVTVNLWGDGSEPEPDA